MAEQTKRSRGPAFTNLAVGAAVLVLLLPLLLKAASGAPPTSAEFAPNARQIIKQAPPGQGVDASGTGASATPRPSASAHPTASATSGPTAAPTPTPKNLSIAQNQLRNCVGPPPLRQTEDPQSPPCVRYWLGKDNGGATALGVTKDAVYIAIPTPSTNKADYLALQNFFNKRYEFYGRRLVFEFCGSSDGQLTESGQNADAAAAAAGCGGPRPFASNYYFNNNGRYYNQTVACRYKIVSVSSFSPYVHSYLNKCAPYAYQYPMEAQEEFTTMGDWICSRLAGRKAAHASGSDGGTGTLNTEKRKFGIFVAPGYADDPVASPSSIAGMTTRLRQCGAAVDPKNIIINPNATSGGAAVDPAASNNAVLQMKSRGVTSIACLCQDFAYGALARAATSQSYHPEWLVTTYGPMDCNECIILGAPPNDQLANLFGLSFQPRQIRPELEPYNMAVREGDPTRPQQTTTSNVGNRNEVYRPLLLLASGIQLAGPNLTPASFRAGLLKAQFPNPFTATHAGAVNFSSANWAMTTDAVEWWWSTSAAGPYSDSSANPGTMCYVAGGARRKIGGWPNGAPDPFFAGTCDSGG